MKPDLKVNILMVDDHLENLLALEAILTPLGQNLVKAASGEEALKWLLKEDFAVILLDVQMPGLDGFETASLIRDRERSRTTPIIFLTAFSNNESFRFRGYSLGAVDYLIKPIEAEILISKVTVFVELFKKTAEIQKQAEQLTTINAELRESEERFRSLSACSPVGIFVIDIEGSCKYTNPRCQAIFEFVFEENFLEGWLELLHPQDRDRVSVSWFIWIQKNQEYSQEFRIQTKSQALRWINLRAAPMLSSQGLLIGHVATVEDITERKQAEEARTQFIREQAARQQAEEANRLKDEFLATLSHELRTPLNSILGWAKLLRGQKFTPEKTLKALETIERNAKLQAQLIEDILDISRIVRGKLHLNLFPVNLVSVVETAIEALRPAFDTKTVNLKFAIHEDEKSVDLEKITAKSLKSSTLNGNALKAQVQQLSNQKFLILGDPDRLQQVVWNLLSNALKFTPNGGSVEVILSIVTEIEDASEQASFSNGQVNGKQLPFWESELAAQKSGKKRQRNQQEKQTSSKGSISYLPVYKYAQIQIKDTGIGIDRDFLPFVFERFRQADGKTTRSYGGLGLGLAIVRHLVELQGGIVGADSEGVNKGATFTVKLPFLEANPEVEVCNVQAEVVEQNQCAPLSGLKLLVVDDDKDTRDLLKQVLIDSGAQVKTVSSASEALKVIKQFSPDILVSDIGMPDEDGYSLIRKVRNLEAKHGGTIPAIALSAYTREEDFQLALSQGFQMNVGKPVLPSELTTAIAQLAGRNGSFEF